MAKKKRPKDIKAIGRPRKQKQVSLELPLFQEVWRHLVLTNPSLAQKVKTYIVKSVFKDGEIPEEWIE